MSRVARLGLWVLCWCSSTSLRLRFTSLNIFPTRLKNPNRRLSPRPLYASTQPERDLGLDPRTLTSLQHWYVTRDYSAIRSCLGAMHDNLPALLHCHRHLNRKAFNIGLSAVLPRMSPAQITRFLDALTQSSIESSVGGLPLQSDTFNTILLDAWAGKNNASLALAWFTEYIENSGRVHPSTRTVNIMMEIARETGSFDRVRSYWSYFSRYALYPDAASYSTLVRCGQDREEVLGLYTAARESGIMNPPLFRCVLESLGKVSDASSALQLALRETRAGENVHMSIWNDSSTGDALLAALLADPEQRLNSAMDTVLGLKNDQLTAADAAFRLKLHGLEAADGSRTRLVCSTKGFCLLFTFIQRGLKQQKRSSNAVSTNRDTSHLIALRDAVWIDLKHELLREVNVILNGRLVDVILRCFMYNVDDMKNHWKNELFPLLLQSKSEPAVRQDCIEKGLEAMMFIGGYNLRPDLGLEVAKTVNKYRPKIAFSPSFKSVLYSSYLNGKSAKSKFMESSTSSPSLVDSLMMSGGFMARGMENSLQIELGVFTARMKPSNTTKIERIRIKLK